VSDEKKVSKQKQYEAALATVCKEHPSQAPQLKKNWNELINGLMGEKVPGIVVYQSFQVPLNSPNENITGSSPNENITRSRTPCQEDVGKFIISAIGILGFMDSPKESALKIVFKNLGPDIIKGMPTMIKDFKDAPTEAKNVIELVKIMNRLYHVGGPLIKDVLFDAVKTIKWYDWAKMVVEITARLVAWFATDSTALIAETVLKLDGVPGLFEAADAVPKTCFSSSTPPLP